MVTRKPTGTQEHMEQNKVLGDIQVALGILKTQMESVQETLSEVKTEQKSNSAALQSLVVVGERISATNDALNRHADSLRRAYSEIEDVRKGHGDRLAKIEKTIPGLVEMRAWVIAAFGTGLAAIGWAVLKAIGLGK